MSTSHGRVLLVEDHHALARTVCLFLENAGFTVDYAQNGESGLQLASQHRYDVFVLDIMLPKMSGLELCEQLRRDAGVTSPVLMLTARDSLEDKLRGFAAGADDYLVKPFDLPELQARLLAMIRRQSGAMDSRPIKIGELSIDQRAQLVTRAGTALRLTPIGYRMLCLLARHSPDYLSREQVEEAIWGDELPDSDALRSHLYQLRQVVDKPFGTSLIQSQQGFGLRIVDQSAN